MSSAISAGLELVSPVEERYFGAAAARGPRALHLYHEDPRRPARRVGYDELLARARGAANLLAERVGPERTYLVLASTELETVAAILGGLLCGALPVPLAPPAGLGGLDAWRARLDEVARALGAELVVGPAAMADLVEGCAGLSFLPADALPTDGPGLPGLDPALSHVQLTSGSTAAPKGVRITHQNLEANLYHIGWGSDVAEDDVVVSWLPLFHDMGLVGCLLFALYWNLELALLPPGAFLSRPRRWLEALSAHRGSLSPAPAFAYPYLSARLKNGSLTGLDLSPWRIAYCGAEPIHRPAVDRFVQHLAGVGLAPGTILPCYGLAEATLAVSFAPVGRGLCGREVSLAGLGEDLLRAPRHAKDATELVLLGRPLPEVEVEVRDAEGRVCAPGRVGRVWLRGPTVTPGYWGHPDRHHGAWLDTGDLGGWVEGELALIGRAKDLIIARGRNLAPVELERAAEAVDGVRAGSAVAFAVPDPEAGTEEAVVACEVRDEESDWARGAIGCLIERAVAERTGLRPRQVLLLPPGTVPKTTSGKVQRSRARALFERDLLGRGLDL
ncbi:MAG: AMP-binding protein [Planctomycetota bacterium]